MALLTEVANVNGVPRPVSVPADQKTSPVRKATEEESISLLEKAGVLCAAEIDRLLRRSCPEQP